MTDDAKPPERPTFDRWLSLVLTLLSAASIVVGMVVYFARLEPAINWTSAQIADVKLAQFEQKSRFEREQADQNARVDRIEESRRDGLQRLARVEEAVTSMKATAEQINAKLDRVLMRVFK